LGRKEYKAHHRRELKSADVVPLTEPDSTTPGPKSFESDRVSTIPRGSAKARNVDDALDILPSILKDIHEALDERDASSVVIGPLVFVVPPSAGVTAPRASESARQDVNIGQLALRYDITLNNPTIALEEYLFSAYLEIERGLCHRDASVRIDTKAVMDRISEQLDQVDRLKREEWERQRDSQDAPSQDGFTSEAKGLDTGSWRTSQKFVDSA
jgi:hypothetical protein